MPHRVARRALRPAHRLSQGEASGCQYGAVALYDALQEVLERGVIQVPSARQALE